MTLREVFSSIANAIRSKTGKTATIKPVDMATEIESIQTGGGDNKLPQFIDGSLTTITAEDLAGATKVREYAFEYSNITNITLPNSVTSIDNHAFSNCSSLTSFTIPDSVTSIGQYAFYYCRKLTQITIPDSVTRIEASAFYYCSSLTSINIPDSITKIGSNTFTNCTALTELTIPANVTTIGSNALRIGTSTKKATITMKPTTPPTISSNTFNANCLNKIIVPVGCGDAYKSATNWSNFAAYIEEATA